MEVSHDPVRNPRDNLARHRSHPAADLDGLLAMSTTAGDQAKNYLVHNGVWDDDYWLCAANIAQKIMGYQDDYGKKYGRRLITALCDVRVAMANAAALVSPR